MEKVGYGNVTRWEEACAKTIQVAFYNIRRKMRSTYFLLNPTRNMQWTPGVDQVLIDPKAVNLAQLNDRVLKSMTMP